MTVNRCWIVCLAVVLSACSSAVTEDPPLSRAAETHIAKSTATPTLDGVRRKGFVQCGVTTGVAGFSTPDAQGEWRGLDVDVCRAIAAAVLGDAKKIRFTPLTAAQRFTALQTGEVDVLSRIKAAASIGPSYWPTTLLIVLPQALRISIPALVNTFIAFFKDTSLVIVIGLFDLLGAAKAVIVDPKWVGFGVEVYLFVAIVYFAFCYGVSQYSQRLERVLIGRG
jgi:Bacterial extracellular solute-binding proteins, family 3